MRVGKRAPLPLLPTSPPPQPNSSPVRPTQRPADQKLRPVQNITWLFVRGKLEIQASAIKAGLQRCKGREHDMAFQKERRSRVHSTRPTY